MITSIFSVQVVLLFMKKFYGTPSVLSIFHPNPPIFVFRGLDDTFTSYIQSLKLPQFKDRQEHIEKALSYDLDELIELHSILAKKFESIDHSVFIPEDQRLYAMNIVDPWIDLLESFVIVHQQCIQ
jgi:hypothetical protein